jgi:hypothetical protein
MSCKTAKFVSAIFAGLFACAPFVTASHGAPAEADKCLSGPKGAPPAGGHWYYRVDRATKRKCWYVGEAGAKIARTAPEAPPATNSVSPPNSAGPQPSIANARAELPLPPARVEPDNSVFTGRPTAVTEAIEPDIDPRAKAGNAGTDPSVVASRWPELASVVSTPAGPEKSIGNSGARPPANSTARPPDSGLAPPAAMAGLPLAAADASSAEKPAGSVQMLLIAILGALALAGLLASAIFRFGGRRRNARLGVERRVNWDAVRTDRPSLSDTARAARSMREIGLLPQGSLPLEEFSADERMAQMLSRLPRSSAT